MPPQTRYDFENESELDAWRTTAGGRLRRSDRHAKSGERSLAWRWTSGDALVCRDAPPDPAEHPRAGFTAWIYNETPRDAELRIVAGSAEGTPRGEGVCDARFRLGFEGWRACYVAFAEHAAEHTDAGTVDTLAILAPPSVAEGEVFLDAVTFHHAVPARSADWQIPHFTGDPGGWTRHRPLLDSRETPRRPLPATVREADHEALETIRRRYETWLLGSERRDPADLPEATRREVEAYIDRGWARREAMGLRYGDDGRIKGPPLTLGRQPGTFYDVHYNALLPIAVDYALRGGDEARDAALALFDYGHDQGWAAGSANGSLSLNGLQTAAYCHAVYLLRDELERTGRLDREIAAAFWYLSFNKSFIVAERPERETNADELRSTVFASLPVVLAVPDPSRRVQHLQSWRDWLHHGLATNPRFAGVLKPDGIAWHHRGCYCGAYSGGALEFSSLAAHLLRETPFALEPWAVGNVARAVRTKALLMRDRAFPHALRGRMLGDCLYTVEQNQWYGFCAMAGYLATVPGPHAQEMAGLFARLWDPDHPLHDDAMRVRMYDDFRCMETPGRRVLLESFAATRPAPEAASVGCWIKPWAGTAVARGEAWSAVIKGWSQYIWDFECHPAAWSEFEQNVFSRYISNGTMQLMLERDADGRGDDAPLPGVEFDHGWDWARWPGSTAKYVPLLRLYDTSRTWQNRWFSDETFLGGVADADRATTAFAVKLHDTCFDPSFRAIKSYFVFGDEIVCLGSNIACGDPDHAVQTTLFQNYLPRPESMPIRVNGEAIAEMPWSCDANEPAHVLDPQGNGYVVPGGQALRLRRHHQQSRDPDNRRDTRGEYAAAWLDHGPEPRSAGYEYAVIVRATPQRLAAFAQRPTYRVLQRDEHAHAVEHPERGVIAAAVFTPERELAFGPVLRSDTPVVFSAQRTGDDAQTIRVADPDLRLPRRGNLGFLTPEDEIREREPSSVTLVLRGRWELVEPDAAASASRFHDGATRIEIHLSDGLSRELPLRRAAT